MQLLSNNLETAYFGYVATDNNYISVNNDNEQLHIGFFLTKKISGIFFYDKLDHRYCWLFTDQPEITLNPLNVTKVEGENVTLTCNVTGNPEPNISWVVKWSSIDTDNSHGIDFSNDREKMTIMNVRRTDSGEYQCMATNNLGNGSSQVATLDVLCKYDVS